MGMSEYMPYNLWMIMFLEDQGYGIQNNVIYQDNQSAIRMEKNGRTSCTGNSRHINIRYFFVQDRIDKGEIKVHYCPTTLILADYFTKPLMGERFREFWRVIMGHKSIFEMNKKYLRPIKERVRRK